MIVPNAWDDAPAMDGGGRRMTTTITLAQSKGGSGKSSLVIGLASALHRSGRRTLILDLDEQRSVHDWLEEAGTAGNGPVSCEPRLRVEAISGEQPAAMLRSVVDRVVKAAEEGYDFVLIDTKGEAALVTAGIAASSDYVLCPTNGHLVEYEPVLRTYKGFAAALRHLSEGADPRMHFRIVFNRIQPVESREVRDARRSLSEALPSIFGIPESSAINLAISRGTTLDLIEREAMDRLERHALHPKERERCRREALRCAKLLDAFDDVLKRLEERTT